MKALLCKTREVSNTEDQEIIGLYLARDERGIRETEKKYGRLCYQIAYNILNNHEDAEECVNDTYAGAWRAIPPARPQHLMSFLCKIARNLSLKRFAYQKREKRSPGVMLSLSELAELLPDDSIAFDAGDGELGKAISRFLRTQKEEARNVFIRKYYFFDSVGEIAARYAFSESKVKNLLFHTRNRLKEYLNKEGITI